MSPRPAAPSSASHSACSTTSPSECAKTPREWATRMPPSMTKSPGPNACTSNPDPILMRIRKARSGAPRPQHRGGERQIRSQGDLEIHRVSLDQYRTLAEPLESLRLVARKAPRSMRAIERCAQRPEAEHLRGERPPQIRALHRLGDRRIGAAPDPRSALQRIAHPRREQPPHGVRAEPIEETPEVGGVETRPGGVVHEDPVARAR